MQRNEPQPIPIPFILTDATKAWLAREYPQIDEVKTTEVFENKMSNAIDYEKRSPYFGQQVHALNWQRKYMTYVRIAMTNKWLGSVVMKQGHEIDMRWAETMTHAKAIGCPIERRSIDSVESFRTRVKNWEVSSSRTTKVIDFDALKRIVK